MHLCFPLTHKQVAVVLFQGSILTQRNGKTNTFQLRTKILGGRHGNISTTLPTLNVGPVYVDLVFLKQIHLH